MVIIVFILGWLVLKLIIKVMVESMKFGLVIVDLVVLMGGNCELIKVDEIIDYNGVKIVGFNNLFGCFVVDVLVFYVKNLVNFLFLLVDEDGNCVLYWDDEII